MKRKTILGSLAATFAVCVGLGFAGLNVSTVRADNEKITMVNGASVRYASESETNGLRFTAIVPQSLYKEGSTYGMFIAPEDYVAENPLDYENLFGENAVYDWAVKNADGEYVYNGTKTRIINISYDSLNANSDGNYVINGSILNIKEGNLSRNFVGRAYVKDGNDYTMADYASVEGVSGAAYNTRSALEVAERAFLTEGLNFDDGQSDTINYYIEKNYSSVSLKAGDGYVQFINKYATDNNTQNVTQHEELTDNLPDGCQKAYKLSGDFATKYEIFNNFDKSEYVRLKFYVKGKYSIPFRGRDDTKENEWVSVEYIRQWNDTWRVFYDGKRVEGADDQFYMGMSGIVYVSELLGVKDVRDDVFTVTYKNGEDTLYTEAVRKGRSAAYKLGGTENLGDGYIKETTVTWLTEKDGSQAANLSAITGNAIVYYSDDAIIYKNHVKPKYVTAMSLNKYIKKDADGNITFKVRLIGGTATVSVHNVDNTHDDSERIILQSDWLSENAWVIFKTDVANEKVYLCDANGNVLKEKGYPDLDVTTLLLCADDTPSADVAAVVMPEVTVTYLDSDGTLISKEGIVKGASGAEYIPADRTDNEGYIHQYTSALWLDENGAEVDLSAVTENTTVYFGGDKIVYKNYEKPNYTNIMSINKYVKADSIGNITFKIRLHGNGAGAYVYGKSDAWSACSVGNWLEAEKWYTITADAATKTVYIYAENGSEIAKSVFEEFDVTQMSLCANDNPNTDVAAVIAKKKLK